MSLRTVWGGQALPHQAVRKDSVAGPRLDTGLQRKSHFCMFWEALWIARHLKNGESAAGSLRKSDTKMQVCNCFPSQGTSLSSPLPASQAGERQNIGPRQTWFEAKFQDSWG